MIDMLMVTNNIFVSAKTLINIKGNNEQHCIFSFCSFDSLGAFNRAIVY